LLRVEYRYDSSVHQNSGVHLFLGAIRRDDDRHLHRRRAQADKPIRQKNPRKKLKKVCIFIMLLPYDK
jgi:hypothetical protein